MVRKVIGLIIFLSVASQASGTLLSGEINSLQESAGVPFYWGDGVNDLYQEWSIAGFNNSGWFYTSEHSWSNTDIYVASGLSDVNSVLDASLFDYSTTGAIQAAEGDTVFFKGVNGFYGAWTITDIFGFSGWDAPLGYLSGTWYFQDDGSGSFSASSVPSPGSLLLFIIGVCMLLIVRVAGARKYDAPVS